MSAHTQSRRAVTASAAIVDLSNPVVVMAQRAARRPWQDMSWSFYRTMPEVRYPANYKGNCLSRFVLRVGVLDPDDPTAPPSIPEGKKKSELVRVAEDAMASFDGPQGGAPEILKRYSINMDIAADGWLGGTDQPDGLGDTELGWEFISIRELTFDTYDGRERAFRDPVGDGQVDSSNPAFLVPEMGFWRRFWNSHPERSQQADGPLESLREECEQLKALNESITARIVSRLAMAGLLYLPNSISMPLKPQNPSEQAELANDPLIVNLIGYIEESMRNRGTAAGALPVLLRGPDDAGEKIRHIVLDNSLDQTEMALRAELRETIVMGQDLPNEVQTGLGSSNHWSAWSIADSTVRNHLQPSADRFADGLTKVFLRPMVKKMWGDDVPMDELRRIVVVADGSGAISRPNEAEDGRQLSDRAVISDTALRTRSGASEQEAPTDEEMARIIGRHVNNPYLALYGLPIHEEIDWDEVAKQGAKEGAPGIGGTPPSKRPADSSDPVGDPADRAKKDSES